MSASAAFSGGAGLAQTEVVTTEVIQAFLDENQNLIMAILETQNLGKFDESARLQGRLQSNLIYLAAVADAQPKQPSGGAAGPS